MLILYLRQNRSYFCVGSLCILIVSLHSIKYINFITALMSHIFTSVIWFLWLLIKNDTCFQWMFTTCQALHKLYFKSSPYNHVMGTKVLPPPNKTLGILILNWLLLRNIRLKKHLWPSPFPSWRNSDRKTRFKKGTLASP